MTKEEAIYELDRMKTWSKELSDEEIEAIVIAIKALEQEPCGDAISRQATQDYIARYLSQYMYDDVREAVEVIDAFIGDLPSVTPRQNMGQWIEHFDEIGKWYECDQCHTDWGGSVNYCPNCGARMEAEE